MDKPSSGPFAQLIWDFSTGWVVSSTQLFDFNVCSPTSNEHMYHDPNLQVGVEENQVWSWMKRRRDKDSHDSDQFPTLQFKICPPLSEFTS
jgi:hypothetical protein